MTRQVFLDTETTGLSPDSGDRVIEIGCIEMVNRRLTGNTLHHYLNPERRSHEDAVKIHGLTDEFLADKPKFAAVADELIAFLQGAEVIIHNAAFDIGFLDAEFKRLGRPLFSTHVHGVCDTLTMAREMFPGKSNSLDALCKRLEVDNTNRTLHGALLDAGLLAEVYIRLTRGQNALVMDSGPSGSQSIEIAAIDLASFELPVIAPSEEELTAHAELLADLDRASKGRTVWRAVA
jgi:DNA polymerase-3 subunit epsilon